MVALLIYSARSYGTLLRPFRVAIIEIVGVQKTVGRVAQGSSPNFSHRER